MRLRPTLILLEMQDYVNTLTELFIMSQNTPGYRRNKEDVKKLLEFLMQEKGMTLLQIGRYLEKSESMVSRWKGGVVPRGPIFEKLLELVRSGRAEMRGPIVIEGVPMVRFPMLGSLPAGEPEEAREEKVGEMELPAIMLGGRFTDCYAIRLEGDSMEPVARKGDWVIVRKNKEPRPGDSVVAQIDGHWCVKTMGKKPGELIPINPKYATLKAKDELKIVGVVIKVLSDPK